MPRNPEHYQAAIKRSRLANDSRLPTPTDQDAIVQTLLDCKITTPADIIDVIKLRPYAEQRRGLGIRPPTKDNWFQRENRLDVARSRACNG